MVSAISWARARLSSRPTRASRVRCSRLRMTTTAPTIEVTERTCLPLMPSRIAGRPRGNSLIGFARSEPQLVQLVVQRLEADPENLRRARLVVAGVLERHQDQTALSFRHRDARAQRHLRLLLAR